MVVSVEPVSGRIVKCKFTIAQSTKHIKTLVSVLVCINNIFKKQDKPYYCFELISPYSKKRSCITGNKRALLSTMQGTAIFFVGLIAQYHDQFCTEPFIKSYCSG